jgi:hypothetical protein
MKAFKLVIFSIVLLTLPSVAGLRQTNSIAFKMQSIKPFKVGEEITYLVHYGLMNAGIAKISVVERTKVDGKMAYHMVGTGKSAGMVDWFFPTKDRYETMMDEKTLQPLRFIRDVDENGYRIKRNIKFNREANTAVDSDLDKDTVFDVPPNVHDIFSAFYFARSLDVSGIKEGDIIDIPVFLDHEMYPFKIKFVKREKIKTDFGRIVCLKFVPVVQEGRVFKDEDDMHLWISDDLNHLPIRIQSELIVGSIKIDIIEYKGLANPIVFTKK